jgi:hypothetical protein
MITVTFNAITTIQNFIQIHQSVQKVNPPQKFKHPRFEIVEATGLNGMESVIFNVIISKQNFIQIHQSVQNLHHVRSLNVLYFGAINVTFSVITSIQNFNQIHQSVQKSSGGSFHTPHKFKRPPCWNEAMGLSSMEYRSS